MQKVDNFLWGPLEPKFTVTQSFLISRNMLLGYRVLSLVSILAIYIWIATGSGKIFLPLQYLTNRGLTFVALYFAATCLCYILYRDESKVNLKKSFSLWRFVILLAELSFSMQIIIPIYFWILLYPGRSDYFTGGRFWQSICSHGVAGLLMYIEVIFNRNRFYRNHLAIVLIFGLIYLAINGIYTAVSGKPVYSTLSWNSISTLYSIIASSIVTGIGFCIGLALTSFKERKLSENVNEYVEMGKFIKPDETYLTFSRKDYNGHGSNFVTIPHQERD